MVGAFSCLHSSTDARFILLELTLSKNIQMNKKERALMEGDFVLPQFFT